MMMLAWALALLATAIMLSGGYRLEDPVLLRLRRLVPARIDGPSDGSGEAHRLKSVYRILSALDASFQPNEKMLRSLGIVRRESIVAIEIVKLILAFGMGVLSLWIASAVRFWPSQWIAPLVGFGGGMVAFNGIVRSLAHQRRRKIRRELAVGIEMLGIFLESGQSLDQAFRSLSEICGEALPHLGTIQKSLVSELDHGVPYEKAIEHWVENLNTEEAKPLAALFVDSLVHGSELVPHLRQYSLDLIEQRIASARSRIGVKSSQLTVVMVLFFLPAILALVAAPAISGVLTTLEISR